MSDIETDDLFLEVRDALLCFRCVQGVGTDTKAMMLTMESGKKYRWYGVEVIMKNRHTTFSGETTAELTRIKDDVGVWIFFRSLIEAEGFSEKIEKKLKPQ